MYLLVLQRFSFALLWKDYHILSLFYVKIDDQLDLDTVDDPSEDLLRSIDAAKMPSVFKSEIAAMEFARMKSPKLLEVCAKNYFWWAL